MAPNSSIQRMLVGWNGLARELTADPARLLGEDDPAAQPRGGERGGTATQAAADDGDVRAKRLHAIISGVLDKKRTAACALEVMLSLGTFRHS